MKHSVCFFDRRPTATCFVVARIEAFMRFFLPFLAPGASLAREQLLLRLSFHEDILRDMAAQVRSNPHIEVGGKFLGRVRGCLDITRRGWEKQLANLEIEILASLDAGPNAQRSAIFHLPDGEYQERLFRRIEAMDPEVEHIGTWHSHHPNGLNRLSEGDVRGYLESVNHEDHNLNFFLATLVVDGSCFETARHFLFLRGLRQRYFELSPEGISIVSGPNPYAEILARSSNVEDRVPELRRQAWYENGRGRQILAADRAWVLETMPGAVAVRSKSSLAWRGEVEVEEERFIVEYLYPEGFPDSPPVVSIRSKEPRERLFLKVVLCSNSEGAEALGRLLKVLPDLFPVFS